MNKEETNQHLAKILQRLIHLLKLEEPNDGYFHFPTNTLSLYIEDLKKGKKDITEDHITVAELLVENTERNKPHSGKLNIHQDLTDKMCHYPSKENSESSLRKFKILNEYGFSFSKINKDSSAVTHRIYYFLDKRKKLPNHLVKIIIELIKMGLNPTTTELNYKSRDFTDQFFYGFTTARLATKINNVDLLKATLENNKTLDINHWDKDKWSLLHYASMHKDGKCMAYLIENNIKIDEKSRFPVKIGNISIEKNSTAIDVSKKFGSNKQLEKLITRYKKT